jgi:glucose 1-dehydrogenase
MEGMSMNLSGKIALITGAGTGIGQGIAAELGRQGVHVAIHYNRSDAGAIATSKLVEQAGGRSYLVQADVSSKAEIERMMKQVAEHYGHIDILVNNAALQLNYSLFDYGEAQYDRIMNTNLKGYWQSTKAVIPYMKHSGTGRIINISSVHAKRPGDFDIGYAMTKGGIRMLTRESAIELANYGITVNAVEPGAIQVGVQSPRDSKPFYSPEEIEKARANPKDIRKRFPLGRVGRPSDVASMVCYIASDESEFMTGSAIRLDGGSMHL